VTGSRPYGGPHATQDGDGRVHVQQHEPAVGEIQGLWEGQFFASLGQGDDLGLGGSRSRGRHLVAASRIRVDGVDPAVASHHSGQSDGHVTAAGAHVGALPALAQTQSVEGGDQRAAVDVVAQFELHHAADDTASRPR